MSRVWARRRSCTLRHVSVALVVKKCLSCWSSASLCALYCQIKLCVHLANLSWPELDRESRLCPWRENAGLLENTENLPE